jgi:hypothetical protein
MRNFFVLITALFLWGVLNISNAQVSANPKANLESQPAWGPAGYNYVEYYYLPDINVYYYVPQHGYYYYAKKQWFYSSTLPALYSNYNFYKMYKIVMNEEAPWRSNEGHLEKYSSFKGRHDQLLIRDTRDSLYFVNQNQYGNNSLLKQQNYIESNVNSDQQNINKNK